MSKIEIFSMKSAKMEKQKLESSLEKSLDSALPTNKRDKNTQPIDTQSLDFDFSLLQKLFPQCAKGLDSKIVGTLLASTNIVGMKTPGLHSIYSSLEFNFCEHSNNSSLGIQCGSVVAFAKGTDAKSANLSQNKLSEVSLEKPQSYHSHTAFVRSTNPHLQNTRIVDSTSPESHADSIHQVFSNSKIVSEKCGNSGKSQGSLLNINDRRDFSQLPHLSPKRSFFRKAELQNNKPSMLYYTYTTHPRLNITTIRTITPFSGTIKAFSRPTPLENESFKSISQSHPTLMKNKPFATQKALVIGAGSGFGNVCVKMLLLGGAEVLATAHSKDFDESHKKLQTLHYDTTSASKEALQQFRAFNPTHIHYFATPKIRSTHTLDKKLLNEFLSFYIFGLHAIIESLETSALTGIFQPSTCFVDELPLDMQAYTIAKSALETYMLFLTKQYHCHTATPRIQKSATNQTLSLIPQNLQKPSTALLDEILKFSKGM
ncbi:hypothetical protein [Helicobacter labetoulli]|uniref:hypothetical protein n=1 Tax=Helicobacter labetoulli TaxID=2315333 RepID=UPI000EF666E7|nr:hypothetical protein [Helicobacter labetoulli]